MITQLTLDMSERWITEGIPTQTSSGLTRSASGVEISVQKSAFLGTPKVLHRTLKLWAWRIDRPQGWEGNLTFLFNVHINKQVPINHHLNWSCYSISCRLDGILFCIYRVYFIFDFNNWLKSVIDKQNKYIFSQFCNVCVYYHSYNKYKYIGV